MGDRANYSEHWSRYDSIRSCIGGALPVMGRQHGWIVGAIAYSSVEPHHDKQRVDQALDVLRAALAEYLRALPRTKRAAYGSVDLQTLLKAFIDRFVEFNLPNRVRTLAFAAKEARNEVAHYVGAMDADDALRHLSNIRRLLDELGATSALIQANGLYQAQLDSIRPREAAPSVVQASENSSRVDRRERLSPARSGHGVEAGPPAISGGLIYFEGDDTAYLGWVAANPEGYVVNVRKRLSDDYVVLHRASCGQVSRPQLAGAYTDRGFRKFCGRTCADVSQAPVWCGRESGGFTKRCRLCRP